MQNDQPMTKTELVGGFFVCGMMGRFGVQLKGEIKWLQN